MVCVYEKIKLLEKPTNYFYIQIHLRRNNSQEEETINFKVEGHGWGPREGSLEGLEGGK